MHKYSKTSLERLRTCHPDLRKVFTYVLSNFDHTIICGHRGEKEQNEAYKKNFSKVRYPNSKHNSYPSMAVDAVPYPVDWKDTNRMRFFAGYVQGIARALYDMERIDHLIRWGGDWDKDTEVKDNKFQDLPHFELYKPIE